MSEKALTIVNVTKQFEDLKAVESLSLSVSEGEFLAIIGPSGCGKTTLLKLIAGLIEPTSGTIEVVGNRNRSQTNQAAFGLMFQEPALLPWRNVRENIALPFELSGQKNVPSVIATFIALVGLTGFEQYYPKELSGGMQQRVSLARALVSDPSILLLDEPFGALDAIMRSKMNDELLRVRNSDTHRQRTTILVTHSIEEAVYLADRVIVLTDRPARITKECIVRLARPRTEQTRFEPEFQKIINSVRTALI